MVVGLLAILKAGGAYVPLDIDYPQSRLDFMIEDSKLSVILIQENLSVRLLGACVPLIYLDRKYPEVADHVGQDRSVPRTASLAYVIYTSGSTGQPKGVMVEHRSMVNFIEGAKKCYGVRAEDRVLQFSSLSFDAAIEEIFLALTTGATLVLRPDSMFSSVLYFLKGCRELDISVLDLPTSYWHELVWEISRYKLRLPESIRLVIIGGERVLPERLAEWHRCVASHVILMNSYGPTETTVAVTVANLSSAERICPDARQIPIGFALDNVQLHLLDKNLQPVTDGMTGELCIGGESVARGYLNRPKLTAEKFIPNPFHQESRLYRTGDFARLLPDGQLEFLGRTDEQVKIRGYRIELGEIEATLRQHHSVKAAVVVARADATGDMRLLAYVVRENPERREPHDLQAFIAQTLPKFMNPSLYIELDALPLSPNGKIDRGLLPEPEETYRNQFSTPVDETERRLAALWEEIFNFAPIGRSDNFFELGGHSLLAVRLFTLIGQEFGVHLPLSTLFEAPTVEKLAAALHGRDNLLPAWSSLVKIQPHGDAPVFFCVHAVGGNVLEYHELARELGHKQPFYALQSYGLHPKYEPHTHVEQMASHYVEEVRRIQPRGPYFLGGRSLGGIIAYEMSCQLLSSGEQVALLALFDTYPNNYRKRVYCGANLNSGSVERVKRHYHNLRQLPPAERLNYMLSKFTYARRAARSRAWQFAYNIFQGFGASLPARLRDIEQFNFMAARNYIPPFYPGKVTLMWACDELRAMNDCLEGWSQLAAGGVEVREIPGDHINIIKDPYVRTLAAELRDCIEQSWTAAEKVETASCC